MRRVQNQQAALARFDDAVNGGKIGFEIVLFRQSLAQYFRFDGGAGAKIFAEARLNHERGCGEQGAQHGENQRRRACADNDLVWRDTVFLSHRRDESPRIGISSQVDRRETLSDGGRHARRRPERIDVCAEVDHFFGRDPPTPRRFEYSPPMRGLGRSRFYGAFFISIHLTSHVGRR
jgi:hypothetical protein